jgi:hypothetical protein
LRQSMCQIASTSRRAMSPGDPSRQPKRGRLTRRWLATRSSPNAEVCLAPAECPTASTSQGE